MSAKDDLAARMARASERKAPSASKAPAPRADPVRLSTDVDPQSYRGLQAYCHDLADSLGRARVPHTEVVRALIDQLARDEALQRTIAAEVGQRLRK